MGERLSSQIPGGTSDVVSYLSLEVPRLHLCDWGLCQRGKIDNMLYHVSFVVYN